MKQQIVTELISLSKTIATGIAIAFIIYLMF